VKFWQDTDIGFMSSCVFIEEAFFSVVKKGERAVVVIPKTKVKMATMLEAISPFGIVNVKIRRLEIQSFFKKKSSWKLFYSD
jgi:hypothetical protein